MSESIPHVTLVLHAKAASQSSSQNFDIVIPLFFIDDALVSNQYTRSFMGSFIVSGNMFAKGKKGQEERDKIIQSLVDDSLLIQKKLTSKEDIEKKVRETFVNNSRDRLSQRPELKSIGIHNPNDFSDKTALFPDVLDDSEYQDLKILNKLLGNSGSQTEMVDETAYSRFSTVGTDMEHDTYQDITIPYKPVKNYLVKNFMKNVQKAVKRSEIISGQYTATLSVYISGSRVNDYGFDRVTACHFNRYDFNGSYGCFTPLI